MATDAALRGTDTEYEPKPAFHHLHYPCSPKSALVALPASLADAFRRQFDCPTLAQRFAWPTLARGDNLLLCAPTGTGKTFAAFLPVFGQLMSDPVQELRCIYIAPLKALTRDIGKNLRRFLREAPALGHLRVGIRTGDTSSQVRRRQIVEPPHILLTTPESLAVMLSQPAARAKLRHVRWAVIDELHALAGGKRGTDLTLSLERLETIAEMPLRRVGLSATCTPLEEAAAFLVGAGRSCSIAEVSDGSDINVAVEPLPLTDETGLPVGFMRRLLNRLDRELTGQRTTLIFANVRSMAERIAWALDMQYPDRAEQIGVHHSSLAPARRREIERRLKQGSLWAVVTSTSLELGIDIGSIDGVVLVHPPRGAARLLQRLGRSGHRPGQARRGLVLTAAPAELIEATVTAGAGRDRQLERLRIPDQPLDVLCQHLAGMAIGASWLPEEALALVRRAHPYRRLSERDFGRCLDYLSGRKADGSSWLPARLAWDEDGRFTLASDGLARLLRRNLGTIISAEPRWIRLVTEDGEAERSVILGSLDEYFADRLQPGDRFLLGGRSLEYRRRERKALVVREAGGRPAPPRWGDSGLPLPPELARRLYLFRAAAAEVLRDGDEPFAAWLQSQYSLDAPAAEELALYLSLQERTSEVPDERVLLVEGVTHDAGIEYAVHTPLPRTANEALARILTVRMTRDFERHVETLASDLGVLLYVRGPEPLEAATWRRLLSLENWSDDFRIAVRESWLLRARFANVATIGLMLLRNPLGGRRKVGGADWAERRLFDQFRVADDEFVLLEQAERETAHDACEEAIARAYLHELPCLAVRCRWLHELSPFAASWLSFDNMRNHARTEVLASVI